MEQNSYDVYFSDGTYEYQLVQVVAFNQDQAVILAKAERINDGLDYTLAYVEEV